MKASKIAYKTLDRLYSAIDSTDRANRGVKLEAWLIAILGSVGFYAAVVYIAYLIKN